MRPQQCGPPGVTTGAALNTATYPDDTGPHRSAEGPTDLADVRLRLEEQRVARRQQRRVEADLGELHRLIRADVELGREAWGSRCADVIRQDQLAGRVTQADFLRLARVAVYLAALAALEPSGGRPW